MPSPDRSFSNMPDSVRLLTASVIFSSPENRIPKPIAMLPMEREFLKFVPMMRMIPMISAIGAREEGLKICSHDPPDASISSRRMI